MLIAEREARAAQAAELIAAKAGLVSKTLEIEKLKVQLARLRRQQFGRSSEKIDRIIEQLELMLDELETEAAVGPAAADPPATDDDAESTAVRRKPPGRRPLPEHLPRREIVHTPDCACPACGGAMRKVGEDVSEVLDYIPGRFEVVRHIRPAFSCRHCGSMAQMPMPSLPVERGQSSAASRARPVERGRPSAALLAHILVGRYCDHLPPDQPHRRPLALELVAPLCRSRGMTGSDQIARLAIALDEVKPPVRRRIEVPLAIRLDRLHRVFQIVLGWEDYHLYQFRIGRDIAYGVPDPDWDFSGSGSRPANKATLADLLVKSKRRVRAGCRIVNTETLEMLQKFGIIELYATFLRFKV